MGQVQAGVGVTALLQIDQHRTAVGLHDEVARVGVERDQAARGPVGAAHTGLKTLTLTLDGRQHRCWQLGRNEMSGLRVDLLHQRPQRVGCVEQR